MGSIRLEKDEDQLTVTIGADEAAPKPLAVIINHSGEILEKHELRTGDNRIDVSAYRGRNCAIRIINDKNVVVRKI